MTDEELAQAEPPPQSRKNAAKPRKAAKPPTSPRKSTKLDGEKRIPIGTAIFAIIVFGILIVGTVSLIISRLQDDGSDVGLYLDGTWETDGPTYSAESIVYIFSGNTFSSVTEMMIFDANPEIIAHIQEFYLYNHGAAVDAEDTGDGVFRLSIKKDGTFSLDGDYILLLSAESFLTEYSFRWNDDEIIIAGDRFMRR